MFVAEEFVTKLWKIEIIVRENEQNRIRETFYCDDYETARALFNKEWGEIGAIWADLKEIV